LNKFAIPELKRQIDPTCVLFGLDDESAPPPCKSTADRKLPLIIPPKSVEISKPNSVLYWWD